MTKRYTSATVLSINIMMQGKYKRHLRFDPFTGSGSLFVTDDLATQNALEKHPQFGKTFVLESEYEQKEVEKKEEEAAEEVKSSSKIYDVSSIQQAKDILVEEYSVSRTKLRSKEAILNMAANLGIEFKGLE